MVNSPSTRPSLLVSIRDCQNGAAWSQFVEIYAPLIYGYARRHGLQDADAADLTQEVLRTLSTAARKLDYNPQRGSFRGWLFTVVRNKLRDLVARNKRPGQGSGDTDVQELLDNETAGADGIACWDHEYEQRVFVCASEQVQCEVERATWQAFWQTAVEGKPGKVVAAQLGMSVAAVYLAKSRVMARLKETVRRLTGE